MTTRLHEVRTLLSDVARGPTAPNPVEGPVRSATATSPRICARSVRIDALRHVRVLDGLLDADLDAVDRRLVASARAPGEAFYRTGQPARILYVLAAGTVQISRVRPSGDPAEPDVIGPGGTFGAMSTVGEPVHTGTAEALTPSCALAMDRAAFREILREHPEVALRVLDGVAARLVRARVHDLEPGGAGTIAQRVAASLLRLADSMGRLRSGVGTLIPVALSGPELADLAAAPPESVSRVMVRLREDGIIDAGRQWTAVLDRRRLEAVARDHEEPVQRPTHVQADHRAIR